MSTHPHPLHFAPDEERDGLRAAHGIVNSLLLAMLLNGIIVGVVMTLIALL